MITNEELQALAEAEIKKVTIPFDKLFQQEDVAIVTQTAKSFFISGYKASSEAGEEEAVEFKDWCDNGNAWFFDNNEQYNHTTKELYKKFQEYKTQKQ